jgi:4-hydroxymandelate oxidase
VSKDRSLNPEHESAATARRKFLKFLAASPAIASVGGVAAFLAQSGLSAQEPSPPAPTSAGKSDVITDASQALDVFDFEEPAHRNVSQGHWAYMVSGVDGDATLRANREGFSHILLRPRRLIDTSKVDMKVNLFGADYNSPIFTCPTGGQKSMHPDGELGVARAAKAHGAPQYLSTNTSTSVEDANAAHGIPVWYQLYAPNIWEACDKLLARVAASGCTVVGLTTDTAGGRNSETDNRLRPADLTQCHACHLGEGPTNAERPMLANLMDIKGDRLPLDWKYVDLIRKSWKGTFLLKGILTPEDTKIAIDHGVDGIHVSNHGGRATETGMSTIETLPYIVAAANGRVPVIVDGGFRRGTDVLKALALGAKAVGIGRPVLWGLGAFGQTGVDKVLDIMQRELRLSMSSCGATSISAINSNFVILPDSWEARITSALQKPGLLSGPDRSQMLSTL